MKKLEEKILQDGVIINNEIIKVDNFLNHQIDVSLIKEFALEVKKFFSDVRVDKVLTIETSGIAIAFAVAEAFDNIPLVFAKKSKSQITDDNVYSFQTKSFTRKTVSDVTVDKRFIKENENILIVDDFLAEGNAGVGLLHICHAGKANVVGFATVIEKAFQGGRQRLEELGVKVYAGASIKAFKDNKPVF